MTILTIAQLKAELVALYTTNVSGAIPPVTGLGFPITSGPSVLSVTTDLVDTLNALVPASGGAVVLNPSMNNIPAIVAANGPGATFLFSPGTYRISSQIAPQNNQRFIGVSGAILSGARVLTGSTGSNPWVFPGIIESGGVAGVVYASYDNHPHDLYVTWPGIGNATFQGSISGFTLTVSNVSVGVLSVGQTILAPGVAANTFILSGSGATWTLSVPQTLPTITMNAGPGSWLQKHVTSLGAVGAGSYYINYGTQTLSMGTNPSGLTVELNSTPSLFALPGANNLYFSGLIFEKFANPAYQGPIGAVGATIGSNWTYENCESRYNHASGLSLGPSFIVRRSFLHHNGQEGYNGGQNLNGGIGTGSNIVFEDNEVAWNNTAGHSIQDEAGGGKISLSSGVIFHHNYVHDNQGAGIWFDADNYKAIVTDNVCDDNWSNGISWEISFDAVIRGNTCRRNGNDGGFNAYFNFTGNTSFGADGGNQILIANSGGLPGSSNGLEVSYNSTDSGWGLGGSLYSFQISRGSSTTYNTPWITQNYRNHHNDVISRNSANNGVNQSGDTVANGNIFEYNAYHMGTTAVHATFFGNGTSWAFWQATPHDTNSTIDTYYGYSPNLIVSPICFLSAWTPGTNVTITQNGVTAPDGTTNASTLALPAGSVGGSANFNSSYYPTRTTVLSHGISVKGTVGQQVYFVAFDAFSGVQNQIKWTFSGSWEIMKSENITQIVSGARSMLMTAYDLAGAGAANLPAVTFAIWGAHANEDATLNAYP